MPKRGLSILCLALLVSCTADNNPQPNILFVITDDQSWIHTSFTGEPGVVTPHFDRIAREGVYIDRAYVSAPSCTASRSAILAGQDFWRLGSAGVLRGNFEKSTLSYQRILKDNGYHTGYTGKGWSPGVVSGEPPVGRRYNRIRFADPSSSQLSDIDYAANFTEFLNDTDKDEPFSFWFSPYEPHRPYRNVQHPAARKSEIRVPGFLPDNDMVRNDLLNYYEEIAWQDQVLGRILQELEIRGLLENTIIVATSDNGMPFPRGKSTNYEFGTRVPLAIRWGNRISAGQTLDAIVNLSDLAPTFLNAAGIPVPITMTGRNLLPLLLTDASDTDSSHEDFSYTITGFERHILTAREGNATYPSRAIHTEKYAYIQNFAASRWPAGDPPLYKDIDNNSPSKNSVLKNEVFLELAAGKRPTEEHYDLNADPYQLVNLAQSPEYSSVLSNLSETLMEALQRSDDPLLSHGPDSFHGLPYDGKLANEQ
ncbi:MAG: sulfatase [Gammaproteobacteria bacterium]|nr:sulfatase [Gammaproteobacteria bacterium]